VFETSPAISAKSSWPGVREIKRSGQGTGLVLGSVTSDMAPALIDCYDSLRGVKKPGTWGVVGNCSS
jgi:hypothetical protein